MKNVKLEQSYYKSTIVKIMVLTFLSKLRKLDKRFFKHYRFFFEFSIQSPKFATLKNALGMEDLQSLNT